MLASYDFELIILIFGLPKHKAKKSIKGLEVEMAEKNVLETVGNGRSNSHGKWNPRDGSKTCSVEDKEKKFLVRMNACNNLLILC